MIWPWLTSLAIFPIWTWLNIEAGSKRIPYQSLTHTQMSTENVVEITFLPAWHFANLSWAFSSHGLAQLSSLPGQRRGERMKKGLTQSGKAGHKPPTLQFANPWGYSLASYKSIDHDLVLKPFWWLGDPPWQETPSQHHLYLLYIFYIIYIYYIIHIIYFI